MSELRLPTWQGERQSGGNDLPLRAPANTSLRVTRLMASLAWPVLSLSLTKTLATVLAGCLAAVIH